MPNPILTTALLAFGLSAPCFCLAAQWSADSLWLLNGHSFELGERDRSIVRIEHADGWAYGDNYIFVDMNLPESDPHGTATTLYGEVTPRLSLGKISGHKPAFGPIQDVLLTGAINSGSGFKAWLYGVSVDLAVPGFAYAQLSAYGRDESARSGSSWQVTPVWLVPFAVGPAKLQFQGFVDFIGAEGSGPGAGVDNYVACPRLWLDVGAFWGAPGHVQAGFEYLYWKNKFGVDGVTEKVFQPAIRLTF